MGTTPVSWNVDTHASIEAHLLSLVTSKTPKAKSVNTLDTWALLHRQAWLAEYLQRRVPRALSSRGLLEHGYATLRRQVLINTHLAHYEGQNLQGPMQDVKQYGLEHRLAAGFTPLHAASGAGLQDANPVLVWQLLNEGADPLAVDGFGHSAYGAAFVLDMAVDKARSAEVHGMLAPKTLSVRLAGQEITLPENSLHARVLNMMLYNLKTLCSKTGPTEKNSWRLHLLDQQGFHEVFLYDMLQNADRSHMRPTLRPEAGDPPLEWTADEREAVFDEDTQNPFRNWLHEQSRPGPLGEQSLWVQAQAEGDMASRSDGLYLPNPALEFPHGTGWQPLADRFGFSLLDLPALYRPCYPDLTGHPDLPAALGSHATRPMIGALPRLYPEDLNALTTLTNTPEAQIGAPGRAAGHALRRLVLQRLALFHDDGSVSALWWDAGGQWTGAQNAQSAPVSQETLQCLREWQQGTPWQTRTPLSEEAQEELERLKLTWLDPGLQARLDAQSALDAQATGEPVPDGPGMAALETTQATVLESPASAGAGDGRAGRPPAPDSWQTALQARDVQHQELASAHRLAGVPEVTVEGGIDAFLNATAAVNCRLVFSYPPGPDAPRRLLTFMPGVVLSCLV